MTLLLALALAGCAGSTPDNDADGDHVDDDTEREGTVITIVTLTGTQRRSVTSDPTKADTDGDGLLDSDELLVRETDPRDVDTDDDGLLDGSDIVATDDERKNAWRALGILEVGGTFLGELDACPTGGPQLRSNVASSDLPRPDQLLDGEELRGWDVQVRGSTRHVASDPCVADTDGDGLADHHEKRLATDPRNADTDGDGMRDGADGDALWDLGLRFEDPVVFSANVTRVRFVFGAGQLTSELLWPGNVSADLDIPDQAAPGELKATLVLRAERPDTGAQLALFEDPRGVILTFDLLAGTVSGAEATGDTLRFAGDDGSATMRWSVTRR